jgi:hypothetical protein
MTHSAIGRGVTVNVPSVPRALAALEAMERELTTAKTYDDIRRIIREATALDVLLGHVAEVKARAEDTILVANQRIGETPVAGSIRFGRSSSDQDGIFADAHEWLS